MKVLHIDSSLQGRNSTSSQLAEKIINKLDVNIPLEVTYRDLNAETIPHLTEARFAAFHTPEADRNPTQQADVALSDKLIDELSGSDVLIIGVPMYNLGVPSTLKSWIDHIARAGKTFAYTANGPQPLLPMPKTYVVATRGGIYANTPADTQTPWLKQVLGFIGITDVEFIYAEGIAMGSAEEAVQQAENHINQLIAI